MSQAAVPISQSYRDKARRKCRCVRAHAALRSSSRTPSSPLWPSLLIARWLRKSKWYAWHAVLQLFTVAFVIASLALGVRSLNYSGYKGPDRSDGHHKLGYVVTAVVIIQSLIGYWAHRVRQGHWVRLFHMPAGIVVMGLLYAQFNSGLGEWNEYSESRTTVPTSVRVIYWVVLAVEVLAYCVGLFMAPKPVLRPTRDEAEKVPMNQMY